MMGEFLEGECGGPSASVSLSSHFTRDKGYKDEGFHRFSSQEFSSRQLVNEFLDETLSGTANPFHMGSLLHEMQSIEQGGSNAVEDGLCWAQQYNHALTNSNPSPLVINHQTNECYKTVWAAHNIHLNQIGPIEEGNIREPHEATDAFKNAAAEFLQMADEHNDTKLLKTEFADFMKKVASGDSEMSVHESTYSGLEEGSSTSANLSEDWVGQFNREGSSSEREETWREEFVATEKDFWDRMASEWEKISTSENLPWLTEFYDYSNINKEYNFSSNNPMESMVNALAEGQKRLESGDLPSAVLCFEAAIKQNPENATAWQLLGTTQAENEQDVQAIAALRKCISLEPDNLTALMALAVSYTNESFQNQACKALKEWVRANPKYSDLMGVSANEDSRNISSLMSKELYDEVKDMFLKAARRNPQESIDADVQTGLSVLFNLSGEPNLAADCCFAALSVRPNDWRLWNRLGATLANGGRSEEAVDAYRNALQLSPGFIRARYNLGITCIHLKAHREAAEHLLIALNQQMRGVGLEGEQSAMSDTIWTTLRLVISHLERPDLMQEVNSKNLSKLNEAFNIN